MDTLTRCKLQNDLCVTPLTRHFAKSLFPMYLPLPIIEKEDIQSVSVSATNELLHT